jgi:hypothetical protein
VDKKKAQPVKTARILYKGAPEQPVRAMEETMRQGKYQPPRALQQQNSKNSWADQARLAGQLLCPPRSFGSSNDLQAVPA